MTHKEKRAKPSVIKRIAHINKDTNPLSEAGVLSYLGVVNAVPTNPIKRVDSVTTLKGKLKFYQSNGLNWENLQKLKELWKKANKIQKNQIITENDA